jgi:ribose 5-phosphate isomerase B
MKYYIATDHTGIEFKSFVKSLLETRGHEVADLGPFSTDRVDYPGYAKKLCQSVLEDSGSMGILICGTGIGMSLAANKITGIRAALCHDAYTGSMARAHNNANVLVLGARVLGLGTAESVIDAWLATEFEGGRHGDRIAMLEC